MTTLDFMAFELRRPSDRERRALLQGHRTQAEDTRTRIDLSECGVCSNDLSSS
jgi:hypothetical protein